ncbi:hypothetical protein KFL_000670080 [Klebsormidium nitens]|uniref:Uncharacterized protein n=1 Tax=Klebsormidium nitens TaxID=105231 RepID=A0A1Y1HQP7_KLENI|nr:hypothetical protein KFL_000670080 [Klebsormidium nitens]|eukprot:GAQ80950.1 hypothetical protein KFL_000670080 [Klebsormidium nitens]
MEQEGILTTLEDLPEDVQWRILKAAVQCAPLKVAGIRASWLRSIRAVNRNWRQFCQAYVTTLHVAWRKTRTGPADFLAGVVQRQPKLETLRVTLGPAKWTQTVATIWKDVIPLVEWRKVSIRGIPRKQTRHSISDSVTTAANMERIQSSIGGLLLSTRLTASKLVDLTVVGFVGQDRMDFAADMAQIVDHAPCLKKLHIDDQALDLNHFLKTVRPSERLEQLRIDFAWVWCPKELQARREALDMLGKFVKLTSLTVQTWESRAELISWGGWTAFRHGTRSPGYNWNFLARLSDLEDFVYGHRGSDQKLIEI